jgi:hypothetical protein
MIKVRTNLKLKSGVDTNWKEKAIDIKAYKSQ